MTKISKPKLFWAQGELPPPPPFDETPSIFLAGPTPRSPDVQSWRPEAVDILTHLLFPGNIFIPESEGYSFDGTYAEQIQWEKAALELADCIVFWIPRDLDTMPAFTTNIEFGRWYKSGKVVLGWPPGTPKMKYFAYTAEEYDIPVSDNLEATLASALQHLILSDG